MVGGVRAGGEDQRLRAVFEDEAGFVVIGHATTMASARPLLVRTEILVVDLGLPDGFGGDLIPELRALWRPTVRGGRRGGGGAAVAPVGRYFVQSVRQLARRHEARVGSMLPLSVVEQSQRQLARDQPAWRRSGAELQSARRQDARV